MRYLYVFAALGLLTGHALGQYDSFGFINDDIAPRFWERDQEFAAAEEPSLVKRDGVCGSGKHPCMSKPSSSLSTSTRCCFF